MQIYVTKRDGSKESFNADRINKSIERECRDTENWLEKVVQIASETRLMLYDGITSEELDHATINAALQNVQEDPAYDTIATRLLLKTIYKRVVGEYSEDQALLAKKHAEKFIAYIKDNVAGGFLDARMATAFDIETLAGALTLQRDGLFGFAGLSTLLDRYALKNSAQKPIETPQFFFMRVAMGLSYNEGAGTPDAKQQATAAAITFYNRMSRLEYIAGGSTNIGAGTSRPALSNCFLLQIEDDMEHIAKSVADVMMLSKAAGGIGASVTKLRASGSPLSSNNTVSSGPTPFAKIIDTAIRAVQRGGKKKGALCFYMENWHLDFPDFLMWRHNAGDDYLRMRTADTAVLLSDEFMRRVKSGEDWYMFDPHETSDLIELYGEAFSKRYAEYVEMAEAGKLRVYKKALAEDQYRQILVMLETTSHPWITWKDTINLRALNNNTGTIHMSNLCTEICLPQDKDNIAVCNLASLNIARHVKDNQIEWKKLEETVRLAIRHLDNLIDINVLPIPEAARSDRENRAVGLGVMGFAEVVELLKFPYDDERSYQLSDMLFEFISYMAIDESANLARSRGSYQHFEGSEWSKGHVPYDSMARVEASRGVQLTVDKTSHAKELGLDWDALREKVKGGMRNATLMAVAPNANIGLVAGTTPGIDPRFAQMFSRNKISGKYLDINHNLVAELKEAGIWDDVRGEIIEKQGDISVISRIPEDMKARYKSAFTTDPYAFIEVAARAQKWIDQALSRNMYLETRIVTDLMDIYTTAWQKGLKTTYYLHMKPRHTAEQSTTTVNKATAIGKTGFGALREAPKAAITESVISPLSMGAPMPTMAPMTASVPVSMSMQTPAAPSAPSMPMPSPVPAAPSVTLSEPAAMVEASVQETMSSMPVVPSMPSVTPSMIPASPVPATAPASSSTAAAIKACPIDPQERLQCDSCQ